MSNNPYTARARRVDENHAEIRDALRARGYSVEDLSGAGSGCPDLMVGAVIDGSPWNFLFEVKRLGVGKLTPAQIRWHDTWQGQVAIVHCAEDALRIIEMRRVHREQSPPSDAAKAPPSTDARRGVAADEPTEINER